jgi:hypothetical protein
MPSSLRLGDQGSDVETLQLKLKACGYDPGDIDGYYGPRTAAAVLAFQKDRPDIDDDGIAGPQTLGALDAAIAKRKHAPETALTERDHVPCNDATWEAFQRLVESVTTRPVRYGPGRGLWVQDRFLITYGAGKVGGTVKEWPNVLNRTYPSFHCTSWTNFFLSWLCRRNQDFTHAGNIPSLFDLVESSPDLHQIPGVGAWRGFGDVCFRIPPDGSGIRRLGLPNVIDLRELLDRRDTLPTFLVWCQSTKQASGAWRWWHHTGLFCVRDRRMFRIAADGTRGPSGYAATPMRYTEITDDVSQRGRVAYRVYGVRASADGSYGDPSRLIANVSFELPV